MADRFPLIANSSANQIQELAAADNLNLANNSIVGVVSVTATTFYGNGANLTGIDAGALKDGNNVKVQNNVSIYTGVVCEDDVFLGPSMVFTNITNPRSAVVRRDKYIRTKVRKGATIGANATIICGNELGSYCLIGAGAVITKEVAPYALVIGNPGKQIGWVSEYGHRLEFNKQGLAICPESGEKYNLKNNSVVKL